MGLYPSEEDLAAVRIGKATTPIGAQRPAADFAWPPANGTAAGAPATPATPASAPAMPLAAVQIGQTIAAAFSPAANATIGIPTAGTTLWVPRWREPGAYRPAAAATRPAAAGTSAARPVQAARTASPALPLKARPAPSPGRATPAAAPAH